MPKEQTKKRTTKKEKNPNAPKRPLSAYMFFVQQKRESVKNDNPEVSFGQLGKLLGQLWKDSDDAAKAPFIELAEKDKARHAAEKEAFEKSK